MRKKINPSAIVALKNALTLIYWRKADLKTFLLRFDSKKYGICNKGC